jgi:P-type Cu+ transporter
MSVLKATEKLETTAALTCYHCGAQCEETLWLEEKSFCCHGCKTVFEILSSNDLCEYYSLDKNPGVQLRNVSDETYSYLDEKEIRRKVVAFDVDNFIRVQFYIPAIHCVSCIWLLENLQKLNKGIVKSEVNFARKSVTIDFSASEVRLSEVARLLAALGYSPKINLESDADVQSAKQSDKSLIVKLAVAGFCFGNVMLFSFPEYLGLDHSDAALQRLFSMLNIALSIPVFFYSGADYFKACYRSIQERQINIDVPIAIGLLALFARSTWDIATGFGPGYLDSFTGLVFFLLIGRWFQSKTYESLAFDRDFKSYFPLAIHELVKDEWKPVIIYSLRKGDQIKVRNMEIVPADSILLESEALVDYSFVTGESKPVKVAQGELIFAGGRLIGQPVTLVVEKKTSQSHLTSLWNSDVFQKTQESKYKKIIDRAARRFTWIVMGIALLTAVYWKIADPSQMWLVLTAVLMVACPCALALAAPFTYGSMLRVFGRNNFYLKNADIIERLAAIDAVVFDKTGTVTHGNSPEVSFVGTMSAEISAAVKQLTSYSTHPLSTMICNSIREKSDLPVSDYRELPGKGITGIVGGNTIAIGSAVFVGVDVRNADTSSRVYVSVNDEVFGYYNIITSVRKGMKPMLARLNKKCAALLSGDNEADKDRMQELFGPAVEMKFNQNPHDKLAYVRDLQQQGRRVLMVGDGLNDSGAIKQSDVGIAVTDDTGVFTPGCDGILHGTRIGSLDKFAELAKSSATILKTGFLISFMYNAIALTFAVSGHLTPLVAAILMPISSISVVSYTSLAVNFVAKRKKL